MLPHLCAEQWNQFVASTKLFRQEDNYEVVGNVGSG